MLETDGHERASELSGYYRSVCHEDGAADEVRERGARGRGEQGRKGGSGAPEAEAVEDRGEGEAPEEVRGLEGGVSMEGGLEGGNADAVMQRGGFGGGERDKQSRFYLAGRPEHVKPRSPLDVPARGGMFPKRGCSKGDRRPQRNAPWRLPAGHKLPDCPVSGAGLRWEGPIG